LLKVVRSSKDLGLFYIAHTNVHIKHFQRSVKGSDVYFRYCCVILQPGTSIPMSAFCNKCATDGGFTKSLILSFILCINLVIMVIIYNFQSQTWLCSHGVAGPIHGWVSIPKRPGSRRSLLFAGAGVHSIVAWLQNVLKKRG